MSTVRVAGTGLLLGAGWGVLARVWMRLITDDPEFSWAGTLSILGLAAWGGLCVSLVHAARLRDGSVWWRLAALPSLAIFASPGMLFLPAYVVGGWAWGSRASTWLRGLVLAGVLGAFPVAMFLAMVPAEEQVFSQMLTVVCGFVALSVPLAWAGSLVLRAWRRSAVVPAPTPVVMA
jgi:hypothetical protein